MKLRNTLILLALAIGAFAYLKFVDSKQLSTDEKQARQGEILEKERVDRDKANLVTIRNSEGTIQIKKTDNVWRLTAPVADRAESMTMNALFTTLEMLRGREVKNPPANAAKDYGVAKGEVSLKIEGSAKPVELLIGKDTAVEGRAYARLEGSDTIYTIDRGLRDQLVKGAKDWRDRKLSDLSASQVTRLALKTAKGEMELEKQGDNWVFTKPFKARGDNEKINDLIANVTTPKVQDFISDSKDLGAYGLNDPRATLTLTAEGQKDPVVLQVGSLKTEKKDEKKDEKKPEEPPTTPQTPPPPGTIYVKLSTREGIVTVPQAIVSLINTQPNDLRDQSLMRVQPDIVDRITIESAKGKIVLARSGEEWVRKVEGKNDERVNSVAATNLLNTLVGEKVARFVADFASDLKGFGLDQPQATVTLSSYSTEGTPETKPGDKPIVKLFLGKFEGDAGYAKLDDEPFIVAASSTLMDSIWTDATQWQELKINDLKKEDITGLEVTRNGQPAVGLLNEKDKGWKLAKGDGKVNQVNVQSLINTLASLRAMRWVGATDAAEQGLDKPSLVVSYTTADKKTGKLTIGKLSQDQMWEATAEGHPGTFLLNQGDFDALNAALVEGEKPAPTPAPGASAVPPAGAPVVPATTEAPKEVPSGKAKPAPESAPKP